MKRDANLSRLTIIAAAALGALVAGAALAQGGHGELVVNAPEGEVSEAEGLAAWERVHAVVSHARCVNCHVGEDNVPIWSGPSYGETRPHGMNINAGVSRIGIEYLPCSTCHATATTPNLDAHAAPHAGHPWMLAPVEFQWNGRTGPEICRQLRDPARNGERDGAALVEHVVHDAEAHAFITWAFVPGGGREAPPGTMQDHLDDMVIWTAAGMPCPDE